jgi:hypothetical protein
VKYRSIKAARLISKSPEMTRGDFTERVELGLFGENSGDRARAAANGGRLLRKGKKWRKCWAGFRAGWRFFFWEAFFFARWDHAGSGIAKRLKKTSIANPVFAGGWSSEKVITYVSVVNVFVDD